MDGIPIKVAMSLFADYKTAESIGIKTINGYLYDLKLLHQSLPSDVVMIEQITTAHVIAFLASEKRRGMSDTTIRARDITLDLFFRWCEDVLDENFQSPIRNLRGRRRYKKPKARHKEPRRATDNEIDALLLSIPQRDWMDLRDRAIIHTMRDTGIRVTETSELLISDVDIEQRIITIRESKNYRYRQIPFTDTTAKAISAYLFMRPLTPPDIAPFLWIGSGNKHGVPASHYTHHGIRQMLKRRCKRAGLPHINPHAIRHLFGIRNLNAGVRAEVVSKMMGHHSVDFTIRYYAPLLIETIQREYDEAW